MIDALNWQLVGWVLAAGCSGWFAWRAGVLGGKASALKRVVTGLPTSIWFVCAAMTHLSLYIGASLVSSIPQATLGHAGSLQSLSIATLTQFGLSASVGGLLLYLVEPRAGANSGTTLDRKDLPVGAWCFVLIVPLFVIVNWCSSWCFTNILHNPPPRNAHTGIVSFLNDPFSTWGLLFACVAVLVTPIAEELAFRVFAQSAASSLFGDTPGRVWLSVLSVSAVFAVLHAAGGPVPWAAVPGLFALSMGMGIAYERTRRAGVPIVMHALFNAANLAMALWAKQDG